MSPPNDDLPTPFELGDPQLGVGWKPEGDAQASPGLESSTGEAQREPSHDRSAEDSDAGESRDAHPPPARPSSAIAFPIQPPSPHASTATRLRSLRSLLASRCSSRSCSCSRPSLRRMDPLPGQQPRRPRFRLGQASSINRPNNSQVRELRIQPREHRAVKLRVPKLRRPHQREAKQVRPKTAERRVRSKRCPPTCLLLSTRAPSR